MRPDQNSIPGLKNKDRNLKFMNKGTVKFFNETKGFGFINDAKNGERIFVHINQLMEQVNENEKVIFEVESGPRGLSAVNVRKQPA